MQRGRFGMAAGIWFAFGGLVSPLHAGTVLVLSQTAAQLTAVDEETGTVHRHLQLAKDAANFTASHDGTIAYVAHPDFAKISVVDLAAWKVKATLDVPGTPFGLAASKSGKLFMGDWNGDAVCELDAITGKTLRAAKIGKAPAHLAVSPDGSRLVAVAREANSVTVFDTATFTAMATLPVGRAPFALAVTHDGTRAIVANAQAGSISIVDLVKLEVSATTRVGAMPYGVAVTRDDATALVTNQQSGSVAVLSGSSRDAATTLKAGNYPEGVAVSDSGKAYVANWFSDDISIIEINGASPPTRIKMPAGPRAVTIVAGSFGR